MSAILGFLYLVLNFALDAVVWIVIASAVVSWLIAFDIINLRNNTVRGLVQGLERLTTPLLAPFRRFIPPIGGLDLTPVILIVLISAAQRTLLPGLFSFLGSALGGPVRV
jgi:YggT family protein